MIYRFDNGIDHLFRIDKINRFLHVDRTHGLGYQLLDEKKLLEPGGHAINRYAKT